MMEGEIRGCLMAVSVGVIVNEESEDGQLGSKNLAVVQIGTGSCCTPDSDVIR